MSRTTIFLEEDGHFGIVCPRWDNHRAQQLPDRKWNHSAKQHDVPATIRNARQIASLYKPEEITRDAKQLLDTLLLKDSQREPFPAWYPFKGNPTSAQKEALNKAFPLDAFAFAMDMGTGKTYTEISYCAAKAMMGQITQVLIVADTIAKPTWREEFELWCPIDYTLFVMEQGKQKAAVQWIEEKHDRLRVLVVGVESLSTGPHAKDVAWKFVSKGNTHMGIDESSSIKTPSAARTRLCWDIGGVCKTRHIMNGTPIDEGVEDFFAQYRFLDWTIIGEKNFTMFKAKYCVMGGFENRKIVGYDNLDELFERIAPYTYEVKIEDVEDMPEQLWQTVTCEPTKEQKKALDDLGDPMMTTVQGDYLLEVETVLERMTRYQQILGGFFPHDYDEETLAKLKKSDPKHGVIRIEGKNPKLDALTSLLPKLPKRRKVIIWAKFAPERELIHQWFVDNKPGEFVHMGSGLDADEKQALKIEFQTNPDIHYFITSQKIAAKSITLHAATISVYYSNEQSYMLRKQSERRTWRKGQHHPCLYIDIVMNHKWDKKIVKALRDKRDIADFVQEELRSNIRSQSA